LEGPARAREELVPRGEARALAVGDHLELPLAPGRVGVVEVTLHEPHQRLLAGEDDRRVGTGCPFDLPRGRGEEPGVLTPGARGRRADQRQPLLELAREVLPRRVALGEVGEPGAVRIGDRLDGEDPPPDAGAPRRAGRARRAPRGERPRARRTGSVWPSGRTAARANARPGSGPSPRRRARPWGPLPPLRARAGPRDASRSARAQGRARRRASSPPPQSRRRA